MADLYEWEPCVDCHGEPLSQPLPDGSNGCAACMNRGGQFVPTDVTGHLDAGLREAVNLTIGWLDLLAANVNLTPFLRAEAAKYRDRLRSRMEGQA